VSARSELVDRLFDEVSMGWPEPWWPQDRAATATEDPLELSPAQEVAMAAYMDLLARVTSGIEYGHHEDYGLGPKVRERRHRRTRETSAA